jgi:Uma2 family endonuclease
MTIAKEPNPSISIYEDIDLPTEEIFSDETPLETTQNIWCSHRQDEIFSDEPPLETALHLEQIILLLTSLELFWDDRNDFFAAGNLTIYYSLRQVKSRDSRGPDFFVVLDTERRPRKSWAVWQENHKFPNIIVEVLSPSTAKVDKTTKKTLYQNIFRTPEYFWFDPYNTVEFAGFRLQNGKYEPIKPNAQGYLWSQELGLYLGLHEGLVRYFTLEGELVPSPKEDALELRQRAAQAEQRAMTEALKMAALLAKLRELNIDPNSL